MFDGTEYWYNIWRKTDLCFLNIFVYSLKNSNFILESKMAELNWKENFTDFFLKLTGCSLFLEVAIGWWKLLY